jgi:hypothetical protein
MPIKDGKSETETKPAAINTRIVVLDRGFVYVGNVADEGECLRISNCRNIRRWGTTRGLGELVDGPLPDTCLDQVGEVLAPKRAVIHQILCNREW